MTYTRRRRDGKSKLMVYDASNGHVRKDGEPMHSIPHSHRVPKVSKKGGEVAPLIVHSKGLGRRRIAYGRKIARAKNSVRIECVDDYGILLIPLDTFYVRGLRVAKGV